MLVAYDEVVATGTSALARLDATAMAASWRLKLRGKVRFERPRTDVLRDLTLSHLIHHRGQLSVYLRLLDVQVPGAYGPTADDRG